MNAQPDLPAPGEPVRVVIVDDSVTMRMMLRRIITRDARIDVVGVAADVEEARAMLVELDPDVLTLDIEMPGTDGISFLRTLMERRPMPVVMCSAVFDGNEAAIVEAMRIGAFDCITKPRANLANMSVQGEDICAVIRAAARSPRARNRPAQPQARPRPATLPAGVPATRTPQSAATAHAPVPAAGIALGAPKLLAIGASTGGVEALFALIPGLPADCPPVCVVQHMPANFTATLAERLDRASTVRVVEATDALPLQRGTVYIAPGGPRHMMLSATDSRLRVAAGEPVQGHSPSVDRLFHSLVRLGGSVTAMLLTGMGEDGARGLLALREAGATTLAQDRESCVVYGMPRAAAAMDAAIHVASLETIAALLARCSTAQTVRA